MNFLNTRMVLSHVYALARLTDLTPHHNALSVNSPIHNLPCFRQSSSNSRFQASLASVSFVATPGHNINIIMNTANNQCFKPMSFKETILNTILQVYILFIVQVVEFAASCTLMFNLEISFQ